jgi:hypothetical protein
MLSRGRCSQFANPKHSPKNTHKFRTTLTYLMAASFLGAAGLASIHRALCVAICGWGSALWPSPPDWQYGVAFLILLVWEEWREFKEEFKKSRKDGK